LYFCFHFRDHRILKHTPEVEPSPELSKSFELDLQQRKQKAEEEKMLRFANSPKTSKFEPVRMSLNNTTMHVGDDTMMQVTEDSFLAMEKMCEQTLHLNNVSENFLDLTLMTASPAVQRKSFKKSTTA
jgi:hypothetical protein